MVTLYLGQWFNPSSPLPKPSFFIFLFPSLQHIPSLNPQFIDIQSFTKKNLSLGSDHPSKPHLCSDDSKESHMSRRKSLVATTHPHPTCAPPAVCPYPCDAVTQAKTRSHPHMSFSRGPQHHLAVLLLILPQNISQTWPLLSIFRATSQV